MKLSGIFKLIGIVLMSTFLANVMAKNLPVKKYRVLIIDGQNNHRNMRDGTQMMKGYLEETGLFSVDVATTPAAGQNMESFRPDFSRYDAVLSNYNGDAWPEATNTAFEKFIKNGGGLIVVHAADNAFPQWAAYNKMIGLGGWGDRNEKSGPYVYYDEAQAKFIRDSSTGVGGSHGNQHEFTIKIRNKNHPITKGMPEAWLHQKDELYDRLRGPAENMEVLATAFSPLNEKGSGRNEPMLMTIKYGKGRIFHTALGHENYSQKCVGFITTLQRGTEWVITGKVTQSMPVDFPTASKGSVR